MAGRLARPRTIGRYMPPPTGCMKTINVSDGRSTGSDEVAVEPDDGPASAVHVAEGGVLSMDQHIGDPLTTRWRAGRRGSVAHLTP